MKKNHITSASSSLSSKLSTTADLKSIMNSENIKISMDAKVWGPHYWFVLFTMASCYPKNPNDVTKKKILRIYSKSTTFYAVQRLWKQF